MVVMVDAQFKLARDRNNLAIKENVVSNEESVKTIERFHRVVKERERCCYAILPFNLLPHMMIARLMITVVFCVRALVRVAGASKVLPPLTIVESIALDYCLHL